MRLEKIGPATGGEAGVQLGGEPGPLSGNGPKKQSISDAPTHLIGGPKVVVRNNGAATEVSVTDAPWGWGDLTRVYLHKPLHPKSAGAERYAAELRQRIVDASWVEHARRERIRDAKLQQRLDELEGRSK